jgi:hypothetical protein
LRLGRGLEFWGGLAGQPQSETAGMLSGSGQWHEPLVALQRSDDLLNVPLAVAVDRTWAMYG